MGRKCAAGRTVRTIRWDAYRRAYAEQPKTASVRGRASRALRMVTSETEVDPGLVITLNAREDARIEGSGVMDAAVENVAAIEDNYPANAVITEDFRDEPNILHIFVIAIVMAFIAGPFVSWMINKLGFGKKGIKPNSVAAYWQASMQGVVPKASLFALLQRWGVRGLPATAKFFIGYITFYITFFFSLLDIA
ncbi:hypothetical protein HPB49_022597 [Dermacentor silvarum]|uniref:Uncharacterized protein n=1 Tax=Dermacentor silvarum TaxID=543639 RepID=A0ACB8CN18_DERSI|nr:hypothetical protein HPB49_022597 [Dermacentor silvarum]